MVRRQDGMALVTVLIMIFVFSLLAWAFVARMHGEQRLVGSASRGTAALYLAEAGAEKALQRLSSSGPIEPGDARSPLEGYQEELGAGKFVIERVAEDPPGTIALTVRGEAGGAVRRIRVVARIVPRALGTGLYAGNTLALTRGARAYVVPTPPSQKGQERLGDIATARELWLDAGVVLNGLDGQMLVLRDARVADHTLFGLSSSLGADFQRQVLPDLIVTGEADLVSVTKTQVIYTVDMLRREHQGINVRAMRRTEASLPTVDLETFRGLASDNHANKALNQTVGDRTFDRTLKDKDGSAYTVAEFEKILAYLDMRSRERREEPRLAGIIYVEGVVSIGRGLIVDDGALIVRGTLRVGDRARLEVRHGPQTKHLPGLVAATDGGTITLGQEATVVVDGVVLASTGLHVTRATMEVRGAILVGQGFLNDGGLVVVRYQPDVLTTIALSRTPHVLVRPVSWQVLL